MRAISSCVSFAASYLDPGQACNDLVRQMASYSKDIRQADFQSFIIRYIDTDNSGHFFLLISRMENDFPRSLP